MTESTITIDKSGDIKFLWDDQLADLLELASAANSAANMISAYECGKTLPSAYTLYKIAESLGVSVNYFCRQFEFGR